MRKLAAWVAPVGSVAAILCAVIALMYASSVRVAVSLPTAANIVDANTAAPGASGLASADPEVTLVHPVHSVEVFDGGGDTASASPTEQPGGTTVTGVAAGDDKQPSPSPRPTARASASKTAAGNESDGTDDPTTSPAPGNTTPTPAPTGTWADDDQPSHSPTTSTSPTGTRSAWPSSSRGDDDGGSGDDGPGDDDDATSSASPSL